MTSLIEWLLDLEGIRLGRDAPLLLRWQNPLEAWLVFCAGLLAVTWVVIIYRRERTSILRRSVLALLRCGLLALVVILLCQPALVLQRNRVQHSYVALAVDTSASMTTREHYVDEALASSVVAGAGLGEPAQLASISRLDLIRAALSASDLGAIEQLLRHNDVQLWTFATAAHATSEVGGRFRSQTGPQELARSIEGLVADGSSTDVAGALHQILERSQERRLSAIVLASDGQSTQATSLQDALALAGRRRVPVYPIRIGSTHQPQDLTIDAVRTRGSAFLDDIISVEVDVRGEGLAEPTPVTVNLVDSNTDEIVAGREWVLGPPGPQGSDTTSPTVELSTKATKAGRKSYRVEITPLPDELVVDNNVAPVDLTVLDHALRVLYVDGYPRYEYRYLKNALVREKTVELSVLLMEADEAFVQEGTLPVRRFPQTPEELNRYDVVLFGDVDPQSRWLSEAQMDMLLNFVGNLGGGFGMIAGQRSSPHRFVGTPLEKLIPVRLGSTRPGAGSPSARDDHRASTTPFQPRVTAQGRRSPLLRLDFPEAAPSEKDTVSVASGSASIIESLPSLYWFAQTLGAKPGASVLLEHPTVRTPHSGSASGGASGWNSTEMPILVTARYGAGKLFFQATDDTWRWRRGDGELVHDAYWVQVVRDLARGNRITQDASNDRSRVSIRTDRRVYPYGAPLHVTVALLDPSLMSRKEDALTVAVTRVTATSDPGDSAGARRTEAVAEFTAFRLPSAKPDSVASSTFEGSWVSPQPGTYVLSVADLPPVTEGPRRAVSESARVRVERPNLEGLHPVADHAALTRIASATGGRMIDLDQLASGFDAIEDRSLRIPDDIVESIWDSKLALAFFALMITMEWVLRKAFGLL